MPVLFAFYLAAVPAYGARPSLLFGFLFLVDARTAGDRDRAASGPAARDRCPATLLVMATWMAMQTVPGFAAYGRSGEGLVAVGFTALFSVFYLVAPLVAGWLARPFGDAAAQAHYAAPLLLAVFPVLAAIEPSFAGAVAADGRARWRSSC